MRIHTVFLSATVSLLAVTGAPAVAATSVAAAAPDAGAPAAASAADIVVTGEKHEMRLQDAPLAITTVDADALRQRNINQLVDANGIIPGLTVTKSEGNERVIAIRGIGYETAQNPNSQPGVAFHIDGVYIAHVVALNQDLLDVDHIEVLRGPQGTVFGQTSTGGAINVITRKPKLETLEGEASLSYGNYNYVRGYATLNLPLGSDLAIRGSVQYLRHDGYGYSIGVPGVARYALDDANNLGAHVSLLWQPSSDFSATLSGQSFDANHHAAEQKCLECLVDPTNPALGYFADPTPGARVVNQDYPGTYLQKTRMAYLSLVKTFDDIAVLKSVTAYQYLNKYQTGDNDRYAYATYYDNLSLWRDYSSTWTQELSLSSAPHHSLEWTTGFFYLRQRALQDITENNSAGFVTDPATGLPVSFETDSPYQHTSIAGFGQIIEHASPALTLVAGLRYSWDKITAQPYQYFAPLTPDEATSDALTGKISIEYQLSADNMVYLTGSKGYKPAGVTFAPATQLVPSKYQPERVWAAELGSKNEFLNRNLIVNASAYYYWYKNFQFTAESERPNDGGTANIPKSNIYGLEVESTWLVNSNFRFDGGISLAKGKFKGDYYTIDKQTALAARTAACAAYGLPYNCYYYSAGLNNYVASQVLAAAENTNGRAVPKLPGVQGNFAGTFNHQVAGGKFTFRAEAVYRGKMNSRIFNVVPYDNIPGYVIGNLYAEFRPDDLPIAVSVTATNFTNANGISNKFADPYGSGTTSVEFIDPRQVYGTVSFKF